MISTKMGIFPSSTNVVLASGSTTNRVNMKADLSTMLELKSDINSTSGFMIPAFTTFILFSLIVHSEYRAVDASFFPQNPPFSRRLTKSGMAPDRPIVTLFSSTFDSLSKAQAAFSLAVEFPVFKALTSGLIAPDEAITSLFSSHKERFKITVTPFSRR
ncbi:hypothetical protein V6N13_039963 [Hibiscus sabdariffa]|uniref:Uncharacterized protein n=1 Tax=Hibiscus sabdariffa TaxID=183260 RepID=A0ABR2SUQ2_9ROSI